MIYVCLDHVDNLRVSRPASRRYNCLGRYGVLWSFPLRSLYGVSCVSVTTLDQVALCAPGCLPRRPCWLWTKRPVVALVVAAVWRARTVRAVLARRLARTLDTA